MAKKTNKKAISKKAAPKRIATRAHPEPAVSTTRLARLDRLPADNSLGMVTLPASTLTVSPASFDDFKSDVQLLGVGGESTRKRRKDSRTKAMVLWNSKDIASVVRVEGDNPGWGMTVL